MTQAFAVLGGEGRLLTGPLLAAAVGLAWGWDAAPELTRSGRGKPLFADRSDRWLSLSHSGGYALCALSDAGPVGADIELVRPHRAGVIQYALSAGELAEFDGSWEDFARLWTRKESWCKREDAPLFPPRLAAPPPDCPCGSYGGQGWRAAVCCHDRPPERLVWLTEEKLSGPGRPQRTGQAGEFYADP